jgi:hypothetical protein
MTQTVEQLKQDQKAALATTDKKQARKEFDRLQALIDDAAYEAKFEATQAEARADEARKQADRDLRASNLAAFETAGAEVENSRKRNAEIVEDIRRLDAKLKEQRAALLGFNGILRNLDPAEDYSRHATDWDNGLFGLLQFHGIPRGGHAARDEPLSPMEDSLNRLAARVAFVRARAKLPQAN